MFLYLGLSVVPLSVLTRKGVNVCSELILTTVNNIEIVLYTLY